MNRIVIVGAGGQLGRALAALVARRSPIALDSAALDIGDPAAVTRRLAELRPDVVFNAAAFNHVDDAETRIDEAFRTNAVGAWALARATHACGALLVHFSTDYVFRGDRQAPYEEEDDPAPQGVYAASKLAGERLVAAMNPLHLVIRTAGLYGEVGGGKGRNFVETMLRLAGLGSSIRVVDDQRLSPTSAADLAAKTVELVERWQTTRSDDLLGLYHIVNRGDASWYEFARAVFAERGMAVDVQPISTTEYAARAPRPAYSVLARRHLERLGLDDLRPWQAALHAYLERFNR